MRSILAMAALLAATMSLNGCITVNAFGGGGDVKVVTVEKGSPLNSDKVAIIPVDGVITGGGGGNGMFSSESSVVDLARKLDAAKSDGNIKAVILRVDSPGGGVTASDIMHRELLQYKKDTGNRVYVSMQSLAASGGYYISMAGDEVYAAPTTVTGSIGVITTFPNASGLMDRFGVSMNSITTGAMKDSGAFYKEMKPAERQLFQDMINDMFDSFIGVIVANRTELGEERIRELADGRIYTAEQAKENGLIDGVMYLDEVIEKARNDVDPKRKASVVLITRTGRDSVETPYARTPLRAAEAKPPSLVDLNLDYLHPATGEAFNLLWIP